MDDIYEQVMGHPPSPTHLRNRARRLRVYHIYYGSLRVMPWLRWPVIDLARVFWINIAEYGIVDTIKPRWGALTFGYLNDGIKPTLYYTIMSVLNKHTGIYPSGAPRNAKEARDA